MLSTSAEPFTQRKITLRPRHAQRYEFPPALQQTQHARFRPSSGWPLRMTKTQQPTFVNYGARTSIGAFGPLMAEQLDPDNGGEMTFSSSRNGVGRC